MLPNEPRIKTLDYITVMISYPSRVSYQNVVSLRSSSPLQYSIKMYYTNLAEMKYNYLKNYCLLG